MTSGKSTTGLTSVHAWGVNMRIIFLVLVTLLSSACSQIFSEEDCSDSILQTVTSRDGKFVANVVRRNCGATTAHANSVFIKNAKNTSERDGKWGDKVFVSQGENPIRIEWREESLTIKASASPADIFLKNDEWNGIKILYE